MALPPIPTSYNDFPSNADVVLEAFSRIQLRPPALTQEHMAEARQSCVFMNAALSNRGLNLWKVRLGSLTLVQGTYNYALGNEVLSILDSYIRVNIGGIPTDTYMNQIGRSDYSAIPNKTDQGKPSQFWFDRILTPEINFYLNPDGNGPYTFNYYFQSQIADVNLTMGYAPDIVFRMMDAYAAELGARLARKYRPAAVADLKVEAAQAWIEASSADAEKGVPLSIAPQLGSYFRRR